MPVFLEREEWDDWLNPATLDDAGMDETLARIAASSERVAATVSEYEVDRRVNSSRTADPEDAGLIAPVAP
jgi:putative SOS response-associated peptidase YedK